MHLAIDYAAEMRRAVFRADGDEIISGVPVIPTFEADRFGAVFVFEEGHVYFPVGTLHCNVPPGKL
jgi:hypothetical protein